MSYVVTPGSETRVNTTTYNSQREPAVATFSDGGYVVAWESVETATDVNIYAQRYNASGTPLGSETRVNSINSISTGNQVLPAVAALTDGGYVVIWSSDGDEFWGIYAQRYNAYGNALGSETRVNTTPSSSQTWPAVTGLSDGGYVVIWHGNYDGAVFAQRYDAYGHALGSETRVNTTAETEELPAVAALSDGGYVVIWIGNDGFSDGIYAQRYDASGTALGSETIVNTTKVNQQTFPAVAALSDGGYVVTWLQSGSEIRAQRYDEFGTAVGGETLVARSPGLTFSAVTGLSDGGYVITWEKGSNAYQRDIYAQQYDIDGNAIGGEILVNTTTTGEQSHSAVAALSDGGYVVTWMSRDQDGSGFGIYSRTFAETELTGALTTSDEYLLGTSNDDLIITNPGALGAGDRIDGGGGIDTLALSAAGTLNLTLPTFFNGVEVVQGSSGDDTLVVNADRLVGVQILDGGTGIDRLQFIGDLDVSTKTLTSIEQIQGSSYGDSLRLTAAQLSSLQWLDLGAGDDTLIADRLVGVQILDGGTGTDRLQFSGSLDASGTTLVSIERIHGSANYDSIQLTAAQLGNLQSLYQVEQVNAASPGTFDFSGLTVAGLSQVSGSSGDDTFVLTPSEATALNYLNGQSGSDTLRLSEAGTVNLAGCYGGGLTLTSVEAFQGSSGNDTVVIDQSVLSVGLGSISGGGGTDTVSWRNGYLDLRGLTSLTGVEKLEGSSSDDALYLNLANLAGLPALEGGAGTYDCLSLDLSTATGNISGNLSDPVPNLHIGGLGTIQITGFEQFFLQGGSGNDSLIGGALDDRLFGGGGDDYLSGGGGSDTLFGEGGNDGFQQLGFNNQSGTSADGGVGNDTFNTYWNTNTTITTGADSDTIRLWSGDNNHKVTVTDFTAGSGGDVLDIRYMLSSFAGWDSSSNPFATGFLRLVQNGTDTDLQWDRDGTTGGTVWTTFVTLQNVTESLLTAANFYPSPNDAPTITSNGGGNTAAASIAENTTAVTTVTATNPDAGQTLSYSIIGGADASKFTIGSNTGALSFVTAPNFEAATDAGGNNVYDVTVQVSDGNGGFDTQAIAVAVTDVLEHTIHNFDGINQSDFLWQHDSGQAAVWLLNGTSAVSGAAVGPNVGPSWHLEGDGDFNADGHDDFLWQHDSGQAAVWLMNGTTMIGAGAVGPNPGPAWHVIDAGDFNADGNDDILWQNDNGQAAVWLMNGTSMIGGGTVGPNPGPTWNVINSGDFNGDGNDDILWQNDNGQAAVWLMNGTSMIGGGTVGTNPGPTWNVIDAGDFNGDGNDDILWQHDSGQAAVWLMNGTSMIGGGTVGPNPGADWDVVGTGEFNNSDTKSDILWQNDNGQAAVWLMNGTSLIGGGVVGGNPGADWDLIA